MHKFWGSKTYKTSGGWEQSWELWQGDLTVGVFKSQGLPPATKISLVLTDPLKLHCRSIYRDLISEFLLLFFCK